MRKILIVEDDPAIGQGVLDSLEWAGYQPHLQACGRSGLNAALETAYDLILLDLALPKLDGLEVLTEIRSARPQQAVIILTARGGEQDRIRGLQLGADDYVVKPFSLHELLARVEAVLRRVPAQDSAHHLLKLNGLEVDFGARSIRDSTGQETTISQKECELLQYLAQHRKRAVSREELLQKVWGLEPKGISTRTIDMHIARLRDKIHDTKDKPAILITIHGCGYRLIVDSMAAPHGGSDR